MTSTAGGSLGAADRGRREGVTVALHVHARAVRVQQAAVHRSGKPTMSASPHRRPAHGRGPTPSRLFLRSSPSAASSSLRTSRFPAPQSGSRSLVSTPRSVRLLVRVVAHVSVRHHQLGSPLDHLGGQLAQVGRFSSSASLRPRTPRCAACPTPAGSATRLPGSSSGAAQPASLRCCVAAGRSRRRRRSRRGGAAGGGLLRAGREHDRTAASDGFQTLIPAVYAIRANYPSMPRTAPRVWRASDESIGPRPRG